MAISGLEQCLGWFASMAFALFHGSPPDGEKLPSQRINSLLGATDGSLWIGTAVGLSRWQNNHLTNYEDQRGVATAIFEDTDSTIWVKYFTIGGQHSTMQDQ